MFAAVIAALYAAMTIIWPFSFLGVQFRVSEALTVLPYFFPVAVPGLFVGCIIANLLSPYGLPDMIIGSVTTLCAALLTMYAGQSEKSSKISTKILACLPPILLNAVFIGALIAYYMVGFNSLEAYTSAFMVNALSVGFGQMVILFALGLPSLIYLPRFGVINALQNIYDNNKPQERKIELTDTGKLTSKDSKE